MVGVYPHTHITSAAELYDPSTGTSAFTCSMNTAREDHTPWTAKMGMQDLETLLKGTKASQWIVLFTANGVSADGTVISGYGLSPKTSQFPFGQWTPFRAVLPVP